MLSHDLQFDIFISYARSDNVHENVTECIKTIEDAYEKKYASQLRIFFDKKNIAHGEDWNRRLHMSLKNSHVMLAFVSENYIKSEWCRKEWRVWCDVERSRGWLSNMLFPIYYSPVKDMQQRIEHFKAQQDVFSKKSLFRKSFAGIETQVDEDACLTDVFSRQLLDITMWKNIDAIDKQQQVDTFINTLHQKISRVQKTSIETDNFVRPNIYFCGRMHELKSIRECFARPQKGLVPIIHGIGGEGKTALAIAYGHAFAYDYPGGRFLVYCEGMASLKECFYKLAENVGLNLSDISCDAAMLQHIWLWLQTRPNGRCLLILDYIDTIDMLAEQSLVYTIKATDNVHVIITTRCACHSLGKTAIPISLRNMLPTDALSLLHFLRPFNDIEEEFALKIIMNLGGHALSVHLAGAFLSENEDISYEEFAEELTKEGILNTLEQTTDSVTSVDYSALNSIEKLVLPSLERFSEEEKTALQLITLLSPDAVIGSWIHEALQFIYPKTMLRKGLKNPWATMSRKFNGLCLWQEQENKNIYQIHRLVCEVIQKHLFNKHTQRHMYQLLHDIATEKADQYIQGNPSWPLSFFLLLVPTFFKWFSKAQNKEDFLCLPEILIGKIARGNGCETKCIELATEVLEYLKNNTSTVQDNIFTAAILACRGQNFLAQGFTDKARHDFSKALTFFSDEVQGESVYLLQKRAEIVDYAGEFERACGNIEQAFALHETALKIIDTLIENSDNDTIHLKSERCYTLDHIAKTYVARCNETDMENALQFYLLALQTRKEICENDESNLRFLRDYANSCDFVGDVYLRLGEYDLANEFHVKSLQMRQELYNKDTENVTFQRDLSIAYNNKGHCLLRNNLPEEAISYYKKSMELRKHMLSKDIENANLAYDYSISMLNMGDMYLEKKLPSEAITYYNDALSIRKKLIAEYPGKASFFYGIAIVHNKCSHAYFDLDDALLAKQALEAAQKTLQHVITMAPEYSPQRKTWQKNLYEIEQKIAFL